MLLWLIWEIGCEVVVIKQQIADSEAAAVERAEREKVLAKEWDDKYGEGAVTRRRRNSSNASTSSLDSNFVARRRSSRENAVPRCPSPETPRDVDPHVEARRKDDALLDVQYTEAGQKMQVRPGRV